MSNEILTFDPCDQQAKPIAVEDEEEEEDDEVLALKDRLAAYNLNSSPDHSAEGKSIVL